MCEQPSTPQGSKAQTPSTLSSTPWREAPKISAPNLGVGNYSVETDRTIIYSSVGPDYNINETLSIEDAIARWPLYRETILHAVARAEAKKQPA
jgi:hypothetical protein